MDSLFPFGFPLPTAVYLSLFVLTWTAHALLMCYVLAGSGYLVGWALLRARTGAGREDPVAALLRDWLPIALGAAITAGVAPLLFLQILYKESFYTANLLLLHRWMAVVPVLIVGFYLLYLGKSKTVGIGAAKLRVAVAIGAFLTFGFVAYSWTENHLLALDRSAWTEFYASGRLAYWNDSLAPRAALWLCTAIPIMAALVGWQLLDARRSSIDSGAALTRVAVIALVGIALVAGVALLYHRTLSEPARAALTGPMARPFLVAAGVGLALQAVAWVWQWRKRRWAAAALGTATVGAVMMVAGVAIARESLRLAGMDRERMIAVHERAWQSGGMPLFFAMLVLGAAVIAWCIATARSESTPHR